MSGNHANLLALDLDDEIRKVPAKGPGRPRVIPMKSLLRSLPTTKQMADKSGLGGIDFSVAGEVLAVLGAINLETALSSDDVPLAQRVDWTLRLAPFLNQLRDGFKRKKGANLPKTTEALAEEASKRSTNIKKLMAALGKTPAEAGEAAAEVVLPESEDEDEEAIPTNNSETQD